MPRITVLFAVLLATLLMACNKAPAAATSTAATPATAAAPVAQAVAVTYQCHSAQKTRDIFLRFDSNGALYMGANATDMKPTGDVVLFDKGGLASWTKKNGTWTETNTFDKNKAEWDWTNDPGPEGMADTAHYQCKAI